MTLEAIWIVGLLLVSFYVPFAWRAMSGEDERNPILFSMTAFFLAAAVGFDSYVAPIGVSILKALPTGGPIIAGLTMLLILLLGGILVALMWFGLAWFIGDAMRMFLSHRKKIQRSFRDAKGNFKC